MDIIINLIIILATGLVFGKIFKIFKLPEEVGYLIGGVVIGIPALNIIPTLPLDQLTNFTTFALAFISFLLGLDLKLETFKKFGAKAIVISIFVALFVLAAVATTIYLLSGNMALALVLGAIATSTATPLLSSIIEHKKDNTELATLATNVSVFDDIVTVILFGITVTIARASFEANVSWLTALDAFKEIGIGIGVGVVVGFLIAKIIKIFNTESEEITIILMTVIGSIAISSYLNISPLLMCTVLGAMITNFSSKSISLTIRKLGDTLIPTIFIIFFVVSGIALNFDLIGGTALLIIGYFISRLISKLISSLIITKTFKFPKRIRNRLGYMLLPHVGLAMGLSLMARELLPEIGDKIQVIVICAGILFEILSIGTINFALRKDKQKINEIVGIKDESN